MARTYLSLSAATTWLCRCWIPGVGLLLGTPTRGQVVLAPAQYQPSTRVLNFGLRLTPTVVRRCVSRRPSRTAVFHLVPGRYPIPAKLYAHKNRFFPLELRSGPQAAQEYYPGTRVPGINTGVHLNLQK
eukprot:1466918-Rhodomonas_salina.2